MEGNCSLDDFSLVEELDGIISTYFFFHYQKLTKLYQQFRVFNKWPGKSPNSSMSAVQLIQIFSFNSFSINLIDWQRLKAVSFEFNSWATMIRKLTSGAMIVTYDRAVIGSPNKKLSEFLLYSKTKRI